MSHATADRPAQSRRRAANGPTVRSVGEPAPAAPPLSRWEKLGWLLMAVLLVAGLPMAYQRAVHNGPDLAGFCDAGRYILQHGARDPESTLSRYWPSADVPWIVFSLLPISVAAVVWYCLNCASWFGLLHTIRHRLLERGAGSTEQDGLQNEHCKMNIENLQSSICNLQSLPTPHDPCSLPARHATLAAGLLAMPLVLDGMALGSFHIFMVWLMLLGLDEAFRGRPVRGGMLLGIAAWLKLLPLMGVAFLVYHRRWKAAATALATVVLLEVSLSLAAFGPGGAWREHVVWWQQGAQGTADRQLAAAEPVDEDRLTNQSVAVTLRRLLTSLGAGDESTSRSYYRARQRVQLADLSPGQLHAVFLTVLALLGVGMAFYCRPVGRNQRSAVPASSLIMVSLATLWFSPVTWSYHFVAAAPAVAALLLAARYRWTWVAPVLAIWCGAHVLLAFDTLRAAGVLLWMSLLLGAGLVAVNRERGAESRPDC